MKTKPWAMALVIFTTFLTASAQILYKMGSDKLAFDLIAILTNWHVLLGLSCYVVSFLLLLVAYRGGEASTLYPIFASSYIWVVLLSNYFFNEPLTTFKVLGVFVIISGITLIARSSATAQYEVPQ